MPEGLNAQTFLSLANEIPVVDVRSPGEYKKGHIPGAVNIPLFDNDERHVIGLLYKKKGRKEAIIKGFEFIGPKHVEIVRKAQMVAIKGRLLLYCWRGGMRSAAMAWLLEKKGIKVDLLLGGYKNYRGFIRGYFSQAFHFLILGGMTGSGKTAILHKIREKGEQVLDLEAIANHKGSAFGALGEKPQPNNEQFENELFHNLFQLDPKKNIWIEDESRNIGKVVIPSEIFIRMKVSPAFIIEAPKQERIKALVEIYGKYHPHDLINCINKISRRLGGLNTQRAVDAVNRADYEMVAGIALNYYDKTYSYDLNKKPLKNIHYIKTESISPDKNANILIDYLKKVMSTVAFSA